MAWRPLVKREEMKLGLRLRHCQCENGRVPKKKPRSVEDGENGGIGRLLLHRLAHMQQQRQRRGIAGLARLGKAEAIAFGDDGGGDDEDMELALAVGEQYAA